MIKGYKKGKFLQKIGFQKRKEKITKDKNSSSIKDRYLVENNELYTIKKLI